ncbi:hypothetical protein QFZ66_005844 [Streptomyces sp. B4I13]|uniref:hypothetical protein n=1 Tax=Streptomyces sp. B4I13 TaxID=3042271 RepID=UPI00277EAC17|nr:hypothetical protein [Streptomyces sp. B4I13]MDQ0961966.1 hypothetical protein [Streptomyces sp. B4I13]
MRLTLLTPDQARAVGAALDRLAAWWRRLREQFTALARRVIDTARDLTRLADLAHAAVHRPDRPAWASPYGPAPKGHR